ncbi:Xaa-Pro dipeptidase [Brevibacillus reuszeri]|uniref:Peptidase M24 n=1 Tax=Brevibacillus reuszeri TaxID=54915 RepID=A0A0K9YTR4_9BACL|nr:Xaa-Pro peptidase family protein [Brevibacillus reuszeri]KNB72098.1 peptidase M24 [Brevibacillus reuszeri]MED1855612.1 Xaa-Pro peptidase family protein [Brevibacillus reuszeri]GED67238.1 Xaa-Pro dipeptidase [Brevibacillus reuszeri]
MLLAIPTDEILQRQKAFLTRLEKHGVEAAILFGVTDIFYLTGFHFHPTERPIGLFLAPNSKSHLFVPALEHEHAEMFAQVDEVHSYPEYPGLRHPMEYLKEELIAAGFEGKTIGLDADGYGSAMGYRGPRVSELLDAKEFVSLRGWVEEARAVKSANELELIKESLRWSHLAHRLLQKYSKAGVNAMEIEGCASHEASMMMLDALGPGYKPYGGYGHNVIAVFRGQVGPMSAVPHAVTQSIMLKHGDTLVTGADAAVWGYHSELERTMFVGEASKEQEKYFQLMLGAQDTAFATIRAGIPARRVEEEVQRYFRENGVTHLTRHHTGHALGLMNHEAPFFDLGEETILQAGMVMSVEPGIYVNGLGGFRHAETIVVTENGMEMLTYYPRDLESLIC